MCQVLTYDEFAEESKKLGNGLIHQWVERSLAEHDPSLPLDLWLDYLCQRKGARKLRGVFRLPRLLSDFYKLATRRVYIDGPVIFLVLSTEKQPLVLGPILNLPLGRYPRLP